MSSFLTQGIILKIIPHREADQLFSIYTNTHGKVFALGRGTKKITSKLNPSLKQLAVLTLMIAPGSHYEHITGVVIEKDFRRIGTDLSAVVFAGFALELIDTLTQRNQAEPELYDFLLEYLELLDNEKLTYQQWLEYKYDFVVKVLTILGLQPPTKDQKDGKSLDEFLLQQLDRPMKINAFFKKMAA
jgi:DNA repair protein RecO (recombination protein O)